jgi:hypothetical protein
MRKDLRACSSPRGRELSGYATYHRTHGRIIFRGKWTPWQSTRLCLAALVVSAAATAGPRIPDMVLNDKRRHSPRGHERSVHPPRHRTRSTGNLPLPRAPVRNPTEMRTRCCVPSVQPARSSPAAPFGFLRWLCLWAGRGARGSACSPGATRRGVLGCPGPSSEVQAAASGLPRSERRFEEGKGGGQGKRRP